MGAKEKAVIACENCLISRNIGRILAMSLVFWMRSGLWVAALRLGCTAK